MPGVFGLALGLVIVAEKVRLSMVVWRDLLIQELFEMRWRRRVASQERGVVWLGIRFLMPGIHGRVFAGCTFGSASILNQLRPWIAWEKAPTLKSSHAVNLLIPSPASLKPSLASSRRSWTLSRTRSVSRFVPRRLSCCESRPIFEVRVKSFSDSRSLKRLNSGSS